MWKAAASGTIAIATLTACWPFNGQPLLQETGDRVVDGGTVVVGGSRIELLSIIPPNEKSPACEAEREAAAKVRARLEGLLKGAKDVDLMNTGMACINSMMRCTGFVTVDGVDLEELLTKEGLVANGYFRGNDVAPFDWCASPREPLPHPSALPYYEELARSRDQAATEQSVTQGNDVPTAGDNEALEVAPPPIQPTP
jgi:endonuclease YncB( thermonuclease family)